MVAENYGYTVYENTKNFKNLGSSPYIEDLNSYQQFENLDLTPIQKFYDGANVFITGSTGFLGKILVEKLLRSCPTISTLYLLVRNKKGKSMEERIDEMFDDVIFSRMKRECPKYRHKVVGVGGDCSLPGLGLTLQDRRLLLDEINVVFHVAATVRFDEKIKTAVAINIRSPLDLLKLAKEMTNLKSYMHVSTVFANCPRKCIQEKIYPPAIDGKKLILMADNVPEKILDEMTPRLLGDYPNTYAFTKQIAEDIVRQESENVPVGIFRPAIVVSTYKEPLEAWIDNMYGPTGVAAGSGVGLLRTLHCNPNVNANLVPVDMCVNSLIASAWQVAEKYQKAVKEEKPFDITVYNYESYNDQPITWGRFMHLSETSGINFPSQKCIWYYCFDLYKSYFVYLVMTFLLHTIPAIIADTALVCMGKSPRMLQAYRKIHKFCYVISYFSTREWDLENNNVRSLITDMTEKDREIFFSDLKQLDWDDFYKLYLKGVRVYLMKDPLDTLESARKRWRRFYIAHQCIKVIGSLLLLQLAFWLLKYIYTWL